jgi:hypothetical protein
MENLSLEEMEATRGGFFNHNNVSVGNTATSVNAAAVIDSANFSFGGVTILQEANSAAGNQINV